MNHALATDIAWALLIPPAGTLLWVLITRGWTLALGKRANPDASGMIRDGWKYLLVILYITTISIFLYQHYVQH
jgi:hypothetical protein